MSLTDTPIASSSLPDVPRFGRSPNDRRSDLLRPPPLNLPPLPPTVQTRRPEDLTIITSNNNSNANNHHNNNNTSNKTTAAPREGAPSADGGNPPLRRGGVGSPLSKMAASFYGKSVVDVLDGQGAMVMTAPIQDDRANAMKGSFFQHTMASLEMKMFASTLAMGADAETKMGQREIKAVQQIADRLAADASRTEDGDVHGERRPPLTLTSVSDCFRLFFGSNVTIFPYYASRLGAVGLVFISAISCVINTNTMMCLHRARHNLVAIELHRRIDENILDANGVTPRGGASSGGTTPRKKDDTDDLNLFIQRAAARAKKEVDTKQQAVGGGSLPPLAPLPPVIVESSSSNNNIIVSTDSLKRISDASPTSSTMINVAASTNTTNSATLGSSADTNTAALGVASPSAAAEPSAPKEVPLITIADYADMQEPISGGDIMPYFMALNSMVKISNALWPKHWLRHVIVCCACVAQFFSCCNFCLLMAKNLAPVVGLEQMPAVVLCATLMGILTMFTEPTTKTYLAYCSNLFIFGGGALLLAASLSHEQTVEERDGAMQLFPKSVVDFIIYSPSVLMFLAAPIVTIDVETIVAARIYPIIKSTFELNRGTITPPLTPTASGGSSPRSGAVSPRSPGASGGGGGGTSPVLSPTSNRNARTYNPSLVYVNIIQKYYGFVMRLGLLICVLILLIIAELILWSFKENTNSVIALSLPESLIRTAILVCLSVGLYACGALNLGPICDILDGFSRSINALSFAPIIKRAVCRAALFSFVVTFLYLIPFFDLVAALSSTIRGSTLVFFIPPACELQSEVLRAAAKSQHRAYAATASSFERIVLGFGHMPARSKIVFVMGMTMGCLVLFVSTFFVVQEAINRQK